MTALVAVHHLQAGPTVVVDAEAASRPAMRIGMKSGEVWDRDQALHALLLVSANDAAYALAASACGGGVQGFAACANEEATRLGIHDSTWSDPAGFDGREGIAGGSTVSAFDLATVARAVLADPTLAPIVGMKSDHFVGPYGRAHDLRQHNKLIGEYPGAIGVKTGYTQRSGQVLVAAARRGSRTLIAVTIGGSDAYGPAKQLLDKGFGLVAGATTGEHLPAMNIAPPSTTASAPRSAAPAPEPTPEPTPLVAAPRDASMAASIFRLTVWSATAISVVIAGLRLRARRRIRRLRSRHAQLRN